MVKLQLAWDTLNGNEALRLARHDLHLYARSGPNKPWYKSVHHCSPLITPAWVRMYNAPNPRERIRFTLT